jgi:hypothetical protein
VGAGPAAAAYLGGEDVINKPFIDEIAAKLDYPVTVPR